MRTDDFFGVELFCATRVFRSFFDGFAEYSVDIGLIISERFGDITASRSKGEKLHGRWR